MLSRHLLNLSRPPASTDSNQGWMWSADRGARNLLGWHQRNGGGRQAGKSRSVRQTDRTRNATWIVQWSWKPILLERDWWYFGFPHSGCS